MLLLSYYSDANLILDLKCFKNQQIKISQKQAYRCIHTRDSLSLDIEGANACRFLEKVHKLLSDE